MLKRIDHVEIVPQDVGRSLAFYTGVLGFTIDHRIPIDAPPLKEVIYLTLNESAIELIVADVPVAPGARRERAGYRLMAWEVDDMKATLRDLAAKGVAASWGPMTQEAYVRAEITDPDGNAIELRQWLKRPSRPKA